MQIKMLMNRFAYNKNPSMNCWRCGSWSRMNGNPPMLKPTDLNSFIPGKNKSLTI